MAVNEAFGWCWIALGFVTGVSLGRRFFDEGWLGGYASWPRRLLRLGHVPLFGLGLLNVLFAAGAGRMLLPEAAARAASWAFLAGGVLMPAACATAAFRKSPWRLFALPVASLLLAGVLTALGMVRAALA